MTKLFITYRREDTAFETTSVHDKLCNHFGVENVFMDVDTIPAGQDFRDIIRSAVQECDVLIAVIGNGWLNSSDSHGRRRIDNPSDFVRFELEAALDRKIPIIPLLVDGVPMLKLDDLPDTLSEMIYRNGLRLRAGSDFKHDIRELIEQITRTVEYEVRKRTPPPTVKPISHSTQAMPVSDVLVTPQPRDSAEIVLSDSTSQMPIRPKRERIMPKSLMSGLIGLCVAVLATSSASVFYFNYKYKLYPPGIVWRLFLVDVFMSTIAAGITSSILAVTHSCSLMPQEPRIRSMFTRLFRPTLCRLATSACMGLIEGTLPALVIGASFSVAATAAAAHVAPIAAVGILAGIELVRILFEFLPKGTTITRFQSFMNISTWSVVGAVCVAMAGFAVNYAAFAPITETVYIFLGLCGGIYGGILAGNQMLAD